MEAIKLFGKTICHKSRFYKQWLSENGIPYDFYELENDEMHQEFLSMFYPNGEQHFPTIAIGNKTFRNPPVNKVDKHIITAGVNQLEEGYSEVLYMGEKYAVTKTGFNHGKSIKVYAKNLSNGDFVPFLGIYVIARMQLKPCEMSVKKVTDFLSNRNLCSAKKGKMYKHFGNRSNLIAV